MREIVSILMQAVDGVVLTFYCFVSMLYQPIVSWILFPAILGGSFVLISTFSRRRPRPRYLPALIFAGPAIIAVAMTIRLGGAIAVPAGFALVGVLALATAYLGAMLGAKSLSSTKS